MRRVYLDHNATSPIRPVAAEAMIHALTLPGNASSVHAEGRAARSLIERAREQVAALVNARVRDVYFASGGTEANNAVLSPRLRRDKAADPAALLIVCTTEHPSVLDGHRFPADNVQRLSVGADGVVDLQVLEAMLAAADGRAIVSIQLANNETGIIQPIRAAADIVHTFGGLLHTDAVQAAGRMPLDIKALGADVMTLSAHKIGGPKGVGAIVLGDGAVDLGGGLIRGGGQERGVRSGTENIAAISGFGAAAQAVLSELPHCQERLENLRDRLERAILNCAPDAVLIGHKVPRLCNTLAVALPGLRAETMLMAFDLAGMAISSGSACSSGKVKRSHVLDAMGINEALAEGMIRVSLGWNSTGEECDLFAIACENVLKSLYERRNDRVARPVIA